jgi:type VII secretion protein EccB
MERALLGADVHADDDSPRAQWLSLVIGAGVAAVAVALCTVMAVLRPASTWGDAGIVVVRGSGALYVRVDDLVHPVLNLTSARLITGSQDAPRQVTEAALDGAARGVLLGIPGAPAEIGEPAADSRWTVCDRNATTVIAGAPATQPISPEGGILVSGPSGTIYLLYGGRRARLDLGDLGVVKALGAESVRPAEVSRALLELVPEVPPISTPPIPGVGASGPSALPGFAVGDVVQVHGASDTQFYVVLAGGVQRIGQVAADVIRGSGRASSITSVAPASLAALPELGVLPVATFPNRITAISGDGQAVCASWRDGTVDLLTGPSPLEPAQTPVQLAQADGAGPRTDAVYVPAGRSAYLTDGTPSAAGWLVTEFGTGFPVADADSARVLGLPAPTVVPRAVLEALPRGPALSRSAALAGHDVVFTGAP